MYKISPLASRHQSSTLPLIPLRFLAAQDHPSKDSELQSFVLPMDCIMVERPPRSGPRSTIHRGVLGVVGAHS